MRNEGFSVNALLQALDTLGIPCELQWRRDPGELRFCSLFAQEPGGVYFVEGDTPPAIVHERAVVLTAQSLPSAPDCEIHLPQPQLAYYRLMRHFFAVDTAAASIHPTAVISPAARIGTGARIGPYCVIGDCEIGADVDLDAHVVVRDGSVLGARVRIESHSTIGATGVAWVWDAQRGERIVQPQIGGATVGDDCFIGTDVTVVRGSINEVTRLGRGCVVAHGTKIGHGCVIGEHVHFANNVSLAGNCRVGDQAFLSAACVLRPRVSLARGVTVGAGAVVTRDVDEEGVVVSGVPARPMDRKSRHSGVPSFQLPQGA